MKREVTISIRQSSMLVWCSLFLLLLLAVWLRWDAYSRTYFADELIPLAVVQHMQESHSLDTNWEHADWRGDYAGGFYKLKQYNFSSYHTTLLALQAFANVLGLGELPELVLYRCISVFFQLLSMLLVFAIAARLSSQWGGVLAACYIAVMPQAVVDAHYARPESFVVFLVALATWLGLRSYLMRNPISALCEAAVWGVAFSCKFSFFPMMILAAMANIYRYKSYAMLIGWMLFFFLGVAVSAPYIIFDISGFLHGVNLLLGQYGSVSSSSGEVVFFPAAAQLFPYALAFYSAPVLFITTISIFDRRPYVRCFSIFGFILTIVYIAIFSRQGVFFERNLSHFLPLWAVMFSMGFYTLFGLKVRQGYLPLIAMIFLGWPLFLSIRINDVFFRNFDLQKQAVSRFEMAEYSGRKILPFRLSQSVSGEALGLHGVLRVPAIKLESMVQLESALHAAGLVQVGRFELPLAFLPYNQLQINHLPPVYLYYESNLDANKVEAP